MPQGHRIFLHTIQDNNNNVNGIGDASAGASETWAWNESQRSRVQAVEMSYLRSACGVNRMDGMSNESVYEHFGMCHVGEGKKYGVVDEVK